MAKRFGLEIKIPDKDVRLWQQRFAVQAPNAFARANKYALDEVAKQAVDGFRREAHKHVDQPTSWMLRGIRYRRAAFNSDWDQQQSSLFVMDDQSSVLKYLMGERRRKPGDVGPSSHYIAVPRSNNLAKVGIRLKNGGNLPSSTLTRLRREAGVTSITTQARPPKGRQAARAATQVSEPAKRRARKGDGGTFFGRPKFNGKTQELGFWSRPTRTKKGGKWVGTRGILMLVYAAQESKHQPILRRFWERNAQRAADDYTLIMGRELQRKLEWMARQG